MCEVKEGFLFTKMRSDDTEKQTLNDQWTRRWFQLQITGILTCFDDCYAEQLVFEIKFNSEHVSRDDVIHPAAEYGKPWIMCVKLREREEVLYLEADCEECMERWAKFILASLPVLGENRMRSKTMSDRQDSPLKPKIPPKPKKKPTSASLKSVKESSHYQYYTFKSLSYQENEEAALIYDYIDKELKSPKAPEYGNLMSESLVKPSTKLAIGRKDCRTLPRKIEKTWSPHLQESDIILPGCSGLERYEDINFSQFLRDSVLPESTIANRYLSEQALLNSLPSYQKLLDDNWVMFFLLPEGNVYTQLIDLTVCIQESLQSLLKCFNHSDKAPDTFLSLEVIGDLYQTYKPQKAQKKKGIHFLEWNNSFSNQGVVTSKVVKVSLRDDSDASLSEERLEEFLDRISHLDESEIFCMSWVSFVKGSFPVMSMSVSARHSACVFLVYNRIPGNEDIDVKKFVPSHSQRQSHMNAVKEEMAKIHSSDTITIYNLFLDNLDVSRSGNVISFPLVLIKRLSLKFKKTNCVFVFGRQHIGLIANENWSSKSDFLPRFWKFSQIMGWFIHPDDDILFIKMSPILKSPDNLILQSPFSESIVSLFRSYCTKEQ